MTIRIANLSEAPHFRGKLWPTRTTRSPRTNSPTSCWSRGTTHLSALEISVDGSSRGTGLSSRMLAAMQSNGARLGFSDLFAPVRPSGKSAEPGSPIEEYAGRSRPDGLPADPWLRVHVRAGAEVVRVAPRSMTISGTLDDWRAWTGLPFDASGEVEVPGALVPVHCSVERGYAVYVEPNVWVHHRLGA